MTKKITEHGKIRIKERVDSNAKVKNLRYQVLNKGKSLYDYKGKFFQYIKTKEKGRFRIKVYKDYIYIFTRNSKRMITTYKVPDKYLPVSKYEVSNKIYRLINLINYYDTKRVKIVLNNDKSYRGVVDYDPGCPRNFTYLILDDGKTMKIYGKDIRKFVPPHPKTVKKEEQLTS